MKTRGPAVDGRRTAPAPPSRIRVFVVDDHALMRRGLAAIIRAERDLLVCGETAAPESALPRIIAARSQVVLIDASSRDLRSLRLIEALRRTDPSIRVVALAMYDKPEYVRCVRSAGATEFVLKTDMAERVLAAIRRAARKSPAVPPPHAEGRDRRPGRVLDERERKVVTLIGHGLTTQTIAVRLCLPRAEVERVVRVVRGKLDLASATQLVNYCVKRQQEPPSGSFPPFV